jgi:hypothetical protein
MSPFNIAAGLVNPARRVTANARAPEVSTGCRLSDTATVAHGAGGRPRPFATDGEPVGLTHRGLACRVYTTDAGLAGAPTEQQLREALTAR